MSFFFLIVWQMTRNIEAENAFWMQYTLEHPTRIKHFSFMF